MHKYILNEDVDDDLVGFADDSDTQVQNADNSGIDASEKNTSFLDYTKKYASAESDEEKAEIVKKFILDKIFNNNNDLMSRAQNLFDKISAAFIIELEDLGWSEESNPFITFLKLLVEKNYDKSDNFTYSKYAAIHNSYQQDLLENINLTDFTNELNILSCPDIYNSPNIHGRDLSLYYFSYYGNDDNSGTGGFGGIDGLKKKEDKQILANKLFNANYKDGEGELNFATMKLRDVDDLREIAKTIFKRVKSVFTGKPSDMANIILRNINPAKAICMIIFSLGAVNKGLADQMEKKYGSVINNSNVTLSKEDWSIFKNVLSSSSFSLKSVDNKTITGVLASLNQNIKGNK